MREVLKDRERAREYEFFRRVDERLLEELRETNELEEQKKALADATGIVEEAGLAELVDVKFTPDTAVC